MSESLTLKQKIKHQLAVAYQLDQASGAAKALRGGPLMDLVETSSPVAIETVAGPSVNIPTARRFTRADTEMLLSGNPVPRIGVQPFAWAIWVKIRALTATDYIFGFEASGARMFQTYALQSTSLLRNSIRLGDTTLADTGTGGPTIVLDAWVFYVGLWNGPGTKPIAIQNMSANNVSTSTTAVTDVSNVATAPVTMGNAVTINTGADVDIAQAMVWIGRVPTRRELNWLYNNGQGRNLSTLGLV